MENEPRLRSHYEMRTCQASKPGDIKSGPADKVDTLVRELE